jgi:ABC-type multidrug transport system ATPase subunit
MIDELSLGLSTQAADDVWHLARNMRTAGVTVIVVEQSLESVLTRAPRAFFLHEGAVRYDGPPELLPGRTDLLAAHYLRAAHHTTALTPIAPDQVNPAVVLPLDTPITELNRDTESAAPPAA